MKVGPKHYELGTKVVITDDALQNIINGNHSIKVHPSDEYVAKARELYRRRLVGEVTRQFPPGYEVNVKFSDGQILQMKDNWFEPAGPDAKSRELPSQPKIVMAPEPWDAERAGKAIGLGLQTKREITIDNFRNMGKLIVPKGTRITVRTDVSKPDGTGILVDAFIRHDAVFYGISIEVEDLEPIARPDAELNGSPSP